MSPNKMDQKINEELYYLLDARRIEFRQIRILYCEWKKCVEKETLLKKWLTCFFQKKSKEIKIKKSKNEKEKTASHPLIEQTTCDEGSHKTNRNYFILLWSVDYTECFAIDSSEWWVV